jgi:hypothetical protein
MRQPSIKQKSFCIAIKNGRPELVSTIAQGKEDLWSKLDTGLKRPFNPIGCVAGNLALRLGLTYSF